jgi:pilus assembly protein CpaB
MAAKRYSLVFYGALAVALAATYGVYRVIESTKANNRVATAPIVVAAVDLSEGKVIDRIELQVAQWPLPTIPPGAYTRVDSVAGRVTRVNVFKGEPLVPGRLAPEGTSAGLETKIPTGKRAMSVRINDVSGLAGMIQPNSRVDILLVANPQGDAPRTARLFMNNMRVLAMGTQVQRGEDGRPIPTTVATLEVFPEEAEKLAVAMAQGSIQLVLRGYGDPDSVTTKGATSKDVAEALRDYVPPKDVPRRRSSPAPQPKAVVTEPAPQPIAPIVLPPKVAQKPETLTIPVYRGAKRSDEKFKKDSVRRDTTIKY